jgi:glycosyltransferase involved in cell wall biosynthesis
MSGSQTALHDMVISVIIPAFNEESCLPATLSSLRDAISVCCCRVELIVVDNDSSDRTGEVARSFGATLVHEAIHNIARVRNAGKSAARGDVLAFVDADTIIPRHFFQKVAAAMSDPACFGGSADIIHTPASKLLRAYLEAWRWFGSRLDMAQGAAQFCRRSAFDVLKGYDASYFMGEDVDFYWRLQTLCRKTGGHLSFLDDVKVVPSPRRFDLTPTWRTLIWTNPVFIALFRKRCSTWTAWYVKTPR